MTKGWECPVCGRGVAPTEKNCEHGGAAVMPYSWPMPQRPSYDPMYDPDRGPWPAKVIISSAPGC